MPIDLKNLPSLIAIPYSETLKKDSIQRKDFQRITLENALSLNAVISLSNYFEQNRPSEEDTKKDKFPELKNFDLGQISVGTWNMFSRETTRSMGTNPKALFLNNIYDMYHGNLAKEWDNLSGTLITIRNKDAHGELIPADKLGAELDKRQDILDKFVSMLDFYKDYKLIVPTSTTLENGKVVYNCRDFSGLLDSAISITNSKDDLELMRIYLFNSKTNRALCLNPMLVAHPISSENKEVKLFLYSKTTNKKLGNLHYLSLDSSKDFTVDNTELIGDYLTSAEICEEFQSFRIYVEDPSLHDQKKPVLAISRKLSNDFISNNDLLEMQLLIKNEGDSTAETVNITMNYPNGNFNLCDKNGEKLNLKKGIEELFDNELSIDAGQSYELKLYFLPKDSGQYEFPEVIVEYEYTDFQGNLVKPKTEKDGTTINIETGASLYCTVYDPADPFSLAPVININMSVDFGVDEKGNKRIFAYIGETIPLTITISNQGLGVAKDVDFTVFVPDGILLDQINTNWKGNINPLQQVTKTYDLKLNEPGIHSLEVRELVYLNQDNKYFKTRGGGFFNILVRNKPEIQYRQLMQQVWADLEIDDEELDEMKYLSKKYGKILDDSVKKTIETDEKMKVIKSIISNIASSKGFKLVERAVNGNRIIYAYNIIDCPILMIDYDNPDDIKIYLRADLQGKYTVEYVSVKGYIRNLPMAKIGMKEPIEGRPQDFLGGTNALKGLLGRAIGWIEKHDWLQNQLKQNFAQGLGISSEQISAKILGNRMSYTLSKDNLLSEFFTYFDNKNNLHLIAKLDRDLSERKKLVEFGSKFMKMNLETDINAFDETGGSASSLLYVSNQRINNDEDKKKFADKLVGFILQLLELQNAELENTLISKNIEAEQIQRIMIVHNTLLEQYKLVKTQERINGLIYKLNYEDKGKNYNFDITYYAIRVLPLYQDKQLILKINSSKNGVNLNFRSLNDSVIDKHTASISFNKGKLPFVVNNIDEVSDSLHQIFQNAIEKSKDELIKPSYYLIKAVMENEWVGSLDTLLETIIQFKQLDRIPNIEEINLHFAENEINIKISKTYSFLKATFSMNKWENFVSYNSKDGFSINDYYLDDVIKALDNYQIVVDDITAKFHKLKLILNKLNIINNPANGLRKIKSDSIYFSVYDESSYCYYEFKNFKKKYIRIKLYIFVERTKGEYLINQVKKLVLTEPKPSIFCLEPVFAEMEYLETKKGCNPNAIMLHIPFSSAEELNSLEFVNKLVNINNEFIKLIFPEEDLSQITFRNANPEDIV